MNTASSNYQRLVAIDTIGASDIANKMPEKERRKIVEIKSTNQGCFVARRKSSAKS
jgi:hypothetical protein